MGDSETDVVYTQEDLLRYEEIIAQIHLRKAHTRRTSMMGAAEIIRVLKTKKHEFDCYGNSLINFLYGVEVVRMMIKLNESYVDDSEEKFKANLKKELALAYRKRDKFIASLLKIKSNLGNIEPRNLRTDCLDDIKSSRELIQTRYSSFITYFNMVMHHHRNIAAIVEVSDELKLIKSIISNVKNGLSEKRKIVSLIDFDKMVEFISDDIDHAIEVLNCQADNLASNILANIADTSELMRMVGQDDKDERDKVPEESSESDDETDFNEEEQRTSTSEEGEEEDLLYSEISSEYDTGDADLACLTEQKPLVKALVQCTLRKPVDPICFVSRFVKNYREKEEQAQRKNEELRLLLAERERIQLKKRTREEEEEMRKRMEEALLLTMDPEGNE